MATFEIAGPDTRRARAVKDTLTGLAFVLPCLVLFMIFRFGPAIAGILLSFFDYTIGGGSTWRGFDHYEHLVNDPDFWTALRVTTVYTMISVPLSMVVATVMALLTRRAFRGARFFRAVFFLPSVTSIVFAGIVFGWIFSPSGPWPKIMGWLGLPQDWLGSTLLVLPAVAVLAVWGRYGFDMLIILARMHDVPPEIEEAAVVDGAGPWAKFWHITLPQLRPALFFVGVLDTINSFQVFDSVYVLTGGGPAHGSYTLVYMLYDQGFTYFNLGYASAVGVALFVLTLVIALIQRLIFGRSDA
ncbi:carbohydrate ABC transporter membrane protein 1, CUT1 family [Micromonospora rhizosphaerae]|uniref:Carbohydrate ABC transporter membrane protein 1, CUT1 family n=1 Tax=Micromonospora rhizosphaerae TaxID=568872 RepID=A0A1C6SB60_9ACTN|nr:sugar ABC transporter permease [Micromonospora rhizosphaerae]SCL26719.1 carbohydrate ABC transporter membrane protein 1, CUT1 family [Micromonospora rhizosphaerae]